MFARPAVIAWPAIGAGTMKSVVTIDPARYRPPAVPVAMTILLAHNFDTHHVVRESYEVAFN
jgi:hypothetical protein